MTLLGPQPAATSSAAVIQKAYFIDVSPVKNVSMRVLFSMRTS
jgi:hypothetical protein